MDKKALENMSTEDLGLMLMSMRQSGDTKETMQPVIDAIKKRSK